MRSKKGFTLIELLVVIAIIALLLAILMPSLKKAKNHAMTAVCLSNLKQLSLSWMMYADANEGKVAKSDINWGNGKPLVKATNWVQTGNTVDAIESGSLWPHVEDLKLYKCPTGKRDELRTYSIVNCMNTDPGNLKKGPIVTKLTKLRQAGTRIVFIDEGKMSNNAFAVLYKVPDWWDRPPVRHNNGVTLSFADGHSDHWKWQDQRTIKLGKEENNTLSQPGNPDLIKMQRATWGGLGYSPATP